MSDSNKITSKEYFERLLRAFPKVELDYDEELGNHYNMERFADYSITQIDSKNWQELQSCFNFQEKYLPFINDEIENALNVSYCESLLCYLTHDEPIVKLMPIQFRKLYIDFKTYFINPSSLNNPQQGT